MKTTTTNEWIGKRAMFTIPIRGRNQTAFEVEVRILEVRHQYGRQDYQVEPLAGRGHAWVQKKFLRVISDEEHAQQVLDDVARDVAKYDQSLYAADLASVKKLTPQEIEWAKFTGKK